MNKPDAVKDSLVKGEFIYDSNTTLMNIFLKDDAKRLLVLGKTGAGKSSLLLEFALECINQARGNRVVPVSLILPLAFWSHDQFPLEDWIYVQSQDSYNLSIEELQQFIQNEQLLLLLDGFDEVDESKRTACIRAINTYPFKKQVPMIVSSRTEEYTVASADEKLDLR